MARAIVRKTYKLLIGGQFVRTESGRAVRATTPSGAFLAHVPLGSRKDVRDAVKAARSAFPGWAGKTPYNRGQILYRAAEMLEERRAEFAGALVRSTGVARAAATREVAVSVDRFVHFAGWADKIAAVLGTVNPVAAPYFDFSVPEPTGVVGLVAPESPALLPLVTRLAAATVSGNTAVAVAPEKAPIPALLLGEVIGTSDFPPGVVNILCGRKGELVPALATHRDVDALDDGSLDAALGRMIDEEAADRVRRIARPKAASPAEWFSALSCEGIAAIEPFVEIKTTWHPAGA
ncbi:MAG TPA: aldehyde dehydrogenase family protein [Thermoanaerobaculia bacterium]|nr:aldehyde dehydrogenase family protein [Thermoanaerobaculia bacterium]